MFRTLSIATVIAASLAAAPAFAAGSVKINLNGKSSDTIAAEVAKAAAYVCRNAVSSVMVPQARQLCIQETIAVTNAKIAKAYMAIPSSTLASN